MTLQTAIDRSVSHTEIVACEFAGDYDDLSAALAAEGISSDDYVAMAENDGTIDVAADDWRLRVTLV